MKALLTAHGFAATRDDDLPGVARSISEPAGRATRGLRHLRIVVAERGADAR